MKARQLRDDLKIMGLGGSVRDRVQINGEGPLVNCWTPFPYKDDDHAGFNKDLESVWQSTIANDDASQIIIMTHEGPLGSSTANCK